MADNGANQSPGGEPKSVRDAYDKQIQDKGLMPKPQDKKSK